ncbi:MAG: hemagglutinin [Aeriscardovia sp.]|nr:hemagglutinin [Aeriscardovia sp.]
MTYRIVVYHLITKQQETYQTYGFNPGHIISNANFFDSSSMSVEQIQEKLSQLGSQCNGTNCLASKQFETHNWAASTGCRAYISPGMQSAAQIIGSAAQSCGINPKVLIVILQKEQGLVTATNPTDESYRIAMGLSCPDHSACNAQYYGFFNQVFGTAERFQYYKNHLSEYNYQVHHINAVRFNPNAACGTQDIYIENEATALLYTYTPYQPNQAALEQTGNSCSSWGNLNFAWIYRQWFGNTQ